MSKSTLLKVLCQYFENCETAVFSRTEKGLENTTNLVRVGSDSYILKIYSKNPESEVAVTNFLAQNNVRLSSIIKSVNGQSYVKFRNKYYILWEYLDGTVPVNPISCNLTNEIARETAKLHRALLQYPIRGNAVYSFKVDKKYIDASDRYLVNLAEQAVFNYDFKKALIHSDLIKENLIVSKDQKDLIGFIDFGDMHIDLLSWDLAVLITQVFITRTKGIELENISLFWKNYSKQFPMERQEIELLIPFMILRNYSLHEVVLEMLEDQRGNREELLSIDKSVLFKIQLIKENQKQLSDIFV